MTAALWSIGAVVAICCIIVFFRAVGAMDRADAEVSLPSERDLAEWRARVAAARNDRALGRRIKH